MWKSINLSFSPKICWKYRLKYQSKHVSLVIKTRPDNSNIADIWPYSFKLRELHSKDKTYHINCIKNYAMYGYVYVWASRKFCRHMKVKLPTCLIKSACRTVSDFRLRIMSDHSCNFPATFPTIQHSYAFLTVTSKLCGSEKVARIWASLSSSLFLAVFMWTTECKTINAFEKRLKKSATIQNSHGTTLQYGYP